LAFDFGSGMNEAKFGRLEGFPLCFVLFVELDGLGQGFAAGFEDGCEFCVDGVGGTALTGFIDA
jgi:hypothetical protein